MNNDVEYDQEEEITKVWDWREILTARELDLIDNPPVHWVTEKASLPLRLIGVYAVGPNSGTKTANDKPEFGWRRIFLTPPTPIMFEAYARITELEAEVELYKGLL